MAVESLPDEGALTKVGDPSGIVGIVLQVRQVQLVGRTPPYRIVTVPPQGEAGDLTVSVFADAVPRVLRADDVNHVSFIVFA